MHKDFGQQPSKTDQDGKAAGLLLERYLSRLENEPDLSPEAFLQEHPEASRTLAASLAAIHFLHGEKSVSGQQQKARVPFERLGEFEIERLIDRGGMGVVFLARQGRLNRRVALKVLPTAMALDPVHRQRFQLEAQVAASLEHPHIVPVYAVGTELDIDYYAMQFIDGITVAHWLSGQRVQALRQTEKTAVQADEATDSSATLEHRTQLATTVPGESTAKDSLTFRKGSTDPENEACLDDPNTLQTPRDIASVGLAVARALAAAHSQGIIHRDVKPSNILLDRSGKPYLSDFGLARVERDTQLTVPGAVIGSLRYMSPEQLDPHRDTIDARCDVYGLGATLYEMLTLTPAVSGANQKQVLNNLLNQEITPPRRLNKHVPRELDTIILTALRLDQRQRYASASEMAADLAAFLENRPIAARRHSWPLQLHHWASRNPLVASLSGILILLLIAGTIASTIVAINMRSLATEQAVALDKLAKQKSRAESLLQLFSRAFRSPDPAEDGRDFTVASMLVKASEQVLVDPTIDDEARGDMLDAIGQSLRGLGDFPAAAEVHQACFELRKRTLGENGLPTLQTMTRLALARRDLSDLNGSIALYLHALERLRQNFSDDHPVTLEAMGALAMAYQDDFQLEAAEPLHRESLERRTRVLGPNDPATLQAMNNLALWLQESSRFDEAYKLHQQTCELRIKILTESHPDSLQSMANLVGAMQDVGKLSEALPLQERTLALHRKVLGESHPNTLICLNNTALFYADLDRINDCVRLFEEVVDKMRNKLGNVHQDTLIAIGNLAYFYFKQGELEKAIDLANQRLQGEKANRGESHVIVANSHSLVGICYLSRWQSMRTKLTSEGSKVENSLSAEHKDIEANDLAESVRHFRQAVAIREREQPGSWLFFREQSRLGEALAMLVESRQQGASIPSTSGEAAAAISMLETSTQKLHESAEEIPATAREEILADADRRWMSFRDKLGLAKD